MVPQKLNLKVVSNKEIADEIYLLRLSSKQNIEFFAGQYLSFKIADKINRSYSIASNPEQKELEFLIELIPNGVGSNFVKNLKPNDEFEALGPLGFFNLNKTKILENNNKVILIGTGSGIAPIRSMVKSLLIHNNERQIELYFGIRFDTKSYFFDEFQALELQYSNFKFTPVVSKPSADWKGEIGHCQNILLKNGLDINSDVLVCGGNISVGAIVDELKNSGHPKEKIFFEKFG